MYKCSAIEKASSATWLWKKVLVGTSKYLTNTDKWEKQMAGLVPLLFLSTNHGLLSVVYNKKGLVEYRLSFLYSTLLRSAFFSNWSNFKSACSKSSRINPIYALLCTSKELRGCPHIISANFGGFQTPPPPLVSNRQQLPDPLPPSSAFVIIWPTPPLPAFKEKHLLIWHYKGLLID